MCVTEDDPLTEQFLRILAVARSQGATIRVLAKCFGVSKSTMGRWMPAIEALASQMGLRVLEKPDDSREPEDACPK